MLKNSIYYRISIALMLIMMTSSCAQNHNYFNSNETATQPPDQIQEPDPSSSRFPAAQGERIHIEDQNAKIDELRIRGQTESIEVDPQNNMPAYEIVPNNPANPDNKATGRSRWRVLSF